MSLPKFINDIVNMTSQEEQVIGTLFHREEFSKGHFLIEQGKICRHMFFLEKGSARYFYYSNEGKEITAWFFTTYNFITALDSFYQHKPTDYYCVLLEDSIIYSIKYSDFEEIFNKSNKMANFLFRSMYEVSYKLSESIFRFQTAQEKYKILLQDFPFIFQRVPLNCIASYLGITPETLSRLRAEK
jgi:CRP/FNR family transcriptional regulator, anaerobic regulatory protein